MSSAVEDGKLAPDKETQAQSKLKSTASNLGSQSSKDKIAAFEKTYNWCRCACDPAQYSGHDHYFLHFETKESRWDEPDEPYWLWDATKQEVDPSGLQQPHSASIDGNSSAVTSNDAHQAQDTDLASKSEPTEEYQGYNPKIHGDYDPTAPYAQYHNRKRDEEDAATGQSQLGEASGAGAYAMSATFNRVTGAFQTADQSVERHSDASKSARQMNAFFDVEAAANAHDGRSLKAERQQKKFSKKEISEMVAKRKEKKLKKRLDFYRS